MLYYVIYKYNVYVYIYICPYIPHSIPMISDSPPAIQPEIIAAPCSTVHPRKKRHGENASNLGNLWKSVEIPWEICEIWENHQRFPGFCSFTKVLHDFSHQNMGRVLQFLQPRSWFLFGLVDWFWMSWFSQDIPKIRYDPNDRCSSSSIHFGRPVRAGF